MIIYKTLFGKKFSIKLRKDLSHEVVIYFQKQSHLDSFSISSSLGHSKYKARKGVLARCVKFSQY